VSSLPYDSAVSTTDDVGTLLEHIASFMRFGDRSEEEVNAWIDELEAKAEPDDLPRLLAAFDDDDVSGALWGILHVAEGMDDHYLEALLDHLPALWARAPQWAITAVLRIVNSAGEEDDCVPRFIELARAWPAAHPALRALGEQMEAEGDFVSDEQRATFLRLLAALPAN